MTDIDLDAVRARADAAHEWIAAIAEGSARWKMSIPADPIRDTDLILSAALADVPALRDQLAEVEAERARLADTVLAREDSLKAARFERDARDEWARDVAVFHGMTREGDDDLFATIAKHINRLKADELQSAQSLHACRAVCRGLRKERDGLRDQLAEVEAERDAARRETAEARDDALTAAMNHNVAMRAVMAERDAALKEVAVIENHCGHIDGPCGCNNPPDPTQAFYAMRERAKSLAAENARLRQELAAANGAGLTLVENNHAMRPVVEAAEAWVTGKGGSSEPWSLEALLVAVDAYRAGQKAPADGAEPCQGDEPTYAHSPECNTLHDGPEECPPPTNTPQAQRGPEVVCRGCGRPTVDHVWPPASAEECPSCGSRQPTDRFEIYYRHADAEIPCENSWHDAEPPPADPPGLDAAIEAARQRVRTVVGLDDDETFTDATIRHAVRAAAPALRAGALREAADEIDYWDRLPPTDREDVMAWLRERADREVVR